jgi:hypothetical protein
VDILGILMLKTQGKSAFFKVLTFVFWPFLRVMALAMA